MTLTVYGQSMSRAIRTLWMVEELGIDYRHVPTTFGAGSRNPDYLAINPNGRVPAIDDDGFRLWESMAINLYLARHHGGPLAPADVQEEALAMQWSFWVMTEVEKTLLQALFHQLGIGGASKDPKVAAQRLEELLPALKVLDGALAGRAYLLGERFTVADLNVASVLTWLPMAGGDLSGRAALGPWFHRCASRPALARAQARE